MSIYIRTPFILCACVCLHLYLCLYSGPIFVFCIGIKFPAFNLCYTTTHRRRLIILWTACGILQYNVVECAQCVLVGKCVCVMLELHLSNTFRILRDNTLRLPFFSCSFLPVLQEMTIAAACAPPGGGRNPVTPRFIRHFTMLCLPTPSEHSLKQIFKVMRHTGTHRRTRQDRKNSSSSMRMLKMARFNVEKLYSS